MSADVSNSLKMIPGIWNDLCRASRKGSRCAKGEGYRRHAVLDWVQVHKLPDYVIQRSIYRLEKIIQVTVGRDVAPSELYTLKYRRSLGKL